MTTSQRIDVTGSWTLVYDAEANGQFTGSVCSLSHEQVVYRIAESAPSVIDPGTPIAGRFEVSLSGLRADKLYARAVDGDASVILDSSLAPSAFPHGLVTSSIEGVSRLAVDPQQTSFEENAQFRFYDDFSLLNSGSGVPAANQIVYRFDATIPLIVFLRTINIWGGGRKYSVYPVDGAETFTGSYLDVSGQVYPINGILRPGLVTHPESGLTIRRAIGSAIFSTTSKPRNGTAVLTDGNANRAVSAYTANGDRSGVAGNQSFYLVFDHIGPNNASKGIFSLHLEAELPNL